MLPTSDPSAAAQRLLIVAPVGKDAALLVGALADAGIEAETCACPKALAVRVRALGSQGPGGIILAEEALDPSRTEDLRDCLGSQPTWSDLPILVITITGPMTPKRLQVIDGLGPVGSVSLLERPFQASTLVSLVRVALRGRRRQYEVRDRLLAQEQSARDIIQKSVDLERSNAELDQFAAVASHDLREPLRMITSYLALVQRRYTPLFDDKAHEYFNYVTSAAYRMREMIESILNYSRVGSEAVEMSWFDSAAAVGDAIDALDVTLKTTQAGIITDHLPKIYANRVLISQVIQNVVSNAIKFCRDVPRIHITVEEDAAHWTVLVRDNGIGIPEEGRDKLFKIFQRMHGADEFAGSGIGLATCKKVAEIHKGRIWIVQSSASGTTIALTIPRPTDASKRT